MANLRGCEIHFLFSKSFVYRAFELTFCNSVKVDYLKSWGKMHLQACKFFISYNVLYHCRIVILYKL